MNRHLTRISQHGHRVATVPRRSPPFQRHHPAGDGGPNNTPDRLTCSVCGFPGIDITIQPGENFPTAYVTTGTRYVWDSPEEVVTTLDLQVLPVPNPAVSCAFCGSARFMDGSKGQGQ